MLETLFRSKESCLATFAKYLYATLLLGINSLKRNLLKKLIIAERVMILPELHEIRASLSVFIK